MKKLFYVTALSAFLLAACGSDENTTDNDSKTTPNEKTKVNEEQKDVYFDGTIAKLVDVQIEITKTKVIQAGEEGNEYGDVPVFAIWYKATNFSDKDIDPITAWLAVFEAIQDNDPNAVNTLNVGGLPDNRFLDSQMQTIKKDGTVENAVAYELDDLETPVTLVATQGIGGDKLGEKVFEIK